MFQNLGLQLYTVRDDMKDAESADRAFAKLVELGYTEAQTAGTDYFGAAEFGALAKKHGIKIVGTHYKWEEILNNPEKVIEVHKIWETTNLGLGSSPAETRTDLGELKKFIDQFNKCAELYAKEGLRMTFHNHHFDFCRIDGKKTIMDLLVENLDPVNTSFVLDTCWVSVGGGDVVEWIEKLQGRLDILHLKDRYIQRLEDTKHYVHAITEVGNGALCWDRIMDAAERTGVKHYVVEQDNNFSGTPYDSLKMTADFLAKYRK